MNQPSGQRIPSIPRDSLACGGKSVDLPSPPVHGMGLASFFTQSAFQWRKRRGESEATSNDASRGLRARDRSTCRRLAPSQGPRRSRCQLRPGGRGGADRRARQVRPAVPGRHRRRQPVGQRRRARPHGQGREVRADDDSVGAGRGDQASRPGRDLDHHLQRALYARPPVRLARPDQRRPRRLEPRHLQQRIRCAELQPRGAPVACRPLRAGDRVRRRRERPVGQLGRGCLHPRQGIGRLLRSLEGSSAEPQGQALPGARPAQCRALAAGPAGAGAGRRVGHRPRCRRAARRTGLHGADHLRAGQGILCRRHGASAEVRPHARPGEGDAGLLSRGGAARSRKPRRSSTTCSR